MKFLPHDTWLEQVLGTDFLTGCIETMTVLVNIKVGSKMELMQKMLLQSKDADL